MRSVRRLRVLAPHLAAAEPAPITHESIVGRAALNDNGNQREGERTIMSYGGLEARHSWSRVERAEEQALQHPLLQDESGAVLPSELAELQERELAAAGRGEYRLAAQLRDMRLVLSPKPPLSLADASPSSLQEQHDFFLENGFLCVKDVLDEAALARARPAYEAAMEPHKQVFLAECARGAGIGSEGGLRWDTGSDHYRTFYNGSFTDLMSKDTVFLDLVDSPKLLPILSLLVGLGGVEGDEAKPQLSPYNGIARSGGMSARVVPSAGNEHGYISWCVNSHLSARTADLTPII